MEQGFKKYSQRAGRITRKKLLLTLVALAISFAGFSQRSWYDYRGRTGPSVQKERLPEATALGNIVPALWHNLVLPYGDRLELDRRSGVSYAQGLSYTGGFYIYPGEYNYSSNIEYVSVEISATCSGKVLTEKGTADELTTRQKKILAAADPDSDLRIKVRFRYKSQPGNRPGAGKIIEGQLSVTVVPEAEAEYPGGFQQLSAYLKEHVSDKLPAGDASTQISQAMIKFTISEEGSIMNAEVLGLPANTATANLLLEALRGMPKWKPAQNSKGVKVKQAFIITLGGGGC